MMISDEVVGEREGEDDDSTWHTHGNKKKKAESAPHFTPFECPPESHT